LVPDPPQFDLPERQPTQEEVSARSLSVLAPAACRHGFCNCLQDYIWVAVGTTVLCG
jgi:hypothetical protein